MVSESGQGEAAAAAELSLAQVGAVEGVENLAPLFGGAVAGHPEPSPGSRKTADDPRRTLTDQWISTLATSSFHRLDHRSQLGTGVPTEDEITLVLRFATEAATRELATTRSEKGFLLTGAKHMSSGRLTGSEFQNPFFGKESQLTTGRVPLPLETGTDASAEAFRARLASIDTRARQMSENFQIGVLHSNDGTNLRLTFSIDSRYHPPAKVSEEIPISQSHPKTAATE